jgi:circadian clock protein KaiC
MSTGSPGLDRVLGGGLVPNRMYLIEGDPGTGKTTLGLQFLLEGMRRGETGMYVTLSETAQELGGVAASHGWSLDGLTIRELAPWSPGTGPEEADYTFFHPSEVELSDTIKTVFADVQRVEPRRVVIDSLSELKLLAREPLRYRRQILALKQFFAGRECTVLLLDDRTAAPGDLQLQSLAHAVIRLELAAGDYGADQRRLRVIKYRGVVFRGGYHDFKIRTGGIVVHPRLVAAEHRLGFSAGEEPSGVDGLDALLGGGLQRGTSTLVLGPAGIGKSLIATLYAVAAAERGEPAVAFLFDETERIYVERSAKVGLRVQENSDAGRFFVRQLDPAEISIGEFCAAVQEMIDTGVRVVVIDSLNGYLMAMPEARSVVAQLHEMLSYLAHRGVTTIMTVAQHGTPGESTSSPVQITYLADTVVLLRFFEAQGRIRRAISVMKKRGGAHESAIREFSIDSRGVSVGEPLANFQGVLTGIPMFVGKEAALLEGADGSAS